MNTDTSDEDFGNCLYIKNKSILWKQHFLVLQNSQVRLSNLFYYLKSLYR